MAKNTMTTDLLQASKVERAEFTIGIDLGDRTHVVTVLDQNGDRLTTRSLPNTARSLIAMIKKYPHATVAIEASTHSAWVSRLLESNGCKVYVSNPRKVKAISASNVKTDERDSVMLAELAYFKPNLLHPIFHQSEDRQIDLLQIKARDKLVGCRKDLMNSVRSLVKPLGLRLSSGVSVNPLIKEAHRVLPAEVFGAVFGMLKALGTLDEQIKAYDKSIERLCQTKYPEVKKLRQIKGVGPITALSLVLFIEDPDRFNNNRDIGPYLGLVPKRFQSGDINKRLGITKAGNSYLRRLLIQSANYILGPLGEDSDLRRFGQRIQAKGGKGAKQRALVAVARKLAVCVLHLWKSGEEYIPFHKQAKVKAA